MFYRRPILRRTFSWADGVVLLFVGAAVVAIGELSREMHGHFTAAATINLSLWALPRYMFFSASRGIIAYVISLTFTLVVGYTAAHSRRAEKIIIPLLDVLQSIPVLGFLPGLVLGLIAIFPNTNLGLEIAAILMIFTGQVWNMTFAFYASLKSIPTELVEASRVMALGWRERFIRVEIPFSSVNLAWNSLMSMAGGWFFLSVCEAFTLGDRDFRLPGLGAYMAESIKRGNVTAMFGAMAGMVGIILSIDFFLWRPMLVWVQRFRLEERPDAAAPDQPHDSFIRLIFHDSRILKWGKLLWRRGFERSAIATSFRLAEAGSFVRRQTATLTNRRIVRHGRAWLWKLFLVVAVAAVSWWLYRLVFYLHELSWALWWRVLKATGFTFGRVMGAVLIATLWTVPVGVWLGRSVSRLRRAQPVIQVLASFPAPMLYPLALHVFYATHLSFEIGAMLLMLLGVQWYVLFNVVAGAVRVQQELNDLVELAALSRFGRWKLLYLPTVFPALVTGWVTAAGGAWNASIVAEYVSYKGSVISATGLGALISQAASSGDFRLLMAGIVVMVALVILLNRTFWAWLYHLAQTRFRIGV